MLGGLVLRRLPVVSISIPLRCYFVSAEQRWERAADEVPFFRIVDILPREQWRTGSAQRVLFLLDCCDGSERGYGLSLLERLLRLSSMRRFVPDKGKTQLAIDCYCCYCCYYYYYY